MKNNLLSDQLVYNGTSTTPTTLCLHRYSEKEMKIFAGDTFQQIKKEIHNDSISWLQIQGLQNTEVIREISEYFGINFLVIQDILNAHHPTKIEEYDAHLVLIMKLFQADKSTQQLLKQQICIIQGENFVLSFTEHDTSFFNDVSLAIENDVFKIRSKQADYLLSVLLNNVMGNYRNIITEIEDSLEKMELSLLSVNAPSNIGAKIQSYRRQYMRMKRSVYPLKEQYSKLLRTESSLVHKSNRVFFNDVNDHLQFVLQTIDICRELLSSLVDLYISNNDLRMNDIMKRLTVVSTIFIPLTFLVGVWGMNFKSMPELEWEHGYFLAWIVMIVTAVLGYIFFKKKKWY